MHEELRHLGAAAPGGVVGILKALAEPCSGSGSGESGSGEETRAQALAAATGGRRAILKAVIRGTPDALFVHCGHRGEWGLLLAEIGHVGRSAGKLLESEVVAAGSEEAAMLRTLEDLGAAEGFAETETFKTYNFVDADGARRLNALLAGERSAGCANSKSKSLSLLIVARVVAETGAVGAEGKLHPFLRSLLVSEEVPLRSDLLAAFVALMSSFVPA